jgi:hypothetical protein
MMISVAESFGMLRSFKEVIIFCCAPEKLRQGEFNCSDFDVGGRNESRSGE